LLILNPAEILSIEMKRWLDINTPHGIAKIAKALMALRNNDGGILIIGLDNNGNLSKDDIPNDVKTTYNPDKIQSFAVKYASSPFEVQVKFLKKEDEEIPVICIPGGIEYPVVCKADLIDGGQYLLQSNKIYVRSLTSNNTVSSSEIRYGDWERLINFCFDNREANVGRFIRRHLANINIEDLTSIAKNISDVIKTDEGIVKQLIENGNNRFSALLEERNLKAPELGFYDYSFKIKGDFPVIPADQNFLTLLSMHNPSLSGWPFWVDSRNFNEESEHPFVNNGTWEALIFSLDVGVSKEIDFWIANPKGEFFHKRVLEDDFSKSHRGPDPLTVFDFSIQIVRLAELIAIALAFAKALGCDEETCSIIFGLHWSKLSNRILDSWASQSHFLRTGGKAYQDEVLSFIEMPLDIPKSFYFSFLKGIC